MSRKRVELYEEPLPDGRCNYRLPYVDPLTGKNKKLSLIMKLLVNMSAMNLVKFQHVNTLVWES